jgi:hypothetical protein
MGYDGKYGKVTTEHGDIPDDEPVIVFRAQDRFSADVLRFYRELCKENGSPQRHLNLIAMTQAKFAAWQEVHANRVKVPDSESSRAWLPE